MTTVHTVGHGTLPAERFALVIRGAGLRQLVDVRSHPGSRHNPQFGREEMERWLPAEGIAYRWLLPLGGRRRPSSGSRHVALRHPSFRGYADHMESAEFLGGVGELRELADAAPTTVMCSEAVWWRCHRRLLADHLSLVGGIEVLHLMHDGRVVRHSPTDGVRVVEGGLTYDVGATPPLPM